MMIIVLLISIAYGALYGVDISTLHSVSTMQCFVNEGYTFIVPRCQRSDGVLDDNCLQNMRNAYAAGMKRVDAYFLPCFSCGNVRGQINTFWNTVSQWDVTFTRLWLDIEGEWSSSYAVNQEFLMALVHETRSIGIVHGIYCNQYHWNMYFTLQYIFRYHSETQMWYAHWNGEASFEYYDVMEFGGWKTPNIKQYQDTTSFCGGSVDFNYEQ